jgi:hypothetical protein
MGPGSASVTGLTEAFQELMAVFDRLEIPFLIGGSVASGTHGLPRQTNDIDILADIKIESIPELVETLSPSFYIAEESVLNALRSGRPFNVIHLASSWKFDIFVAGDDPFAKSEIVRRKMADTTITGLENIEFPVATAEDTILAKLVWFRKGGEVSDRQWHDLLGIVRIQAGRLDIEYLKRWASVLGVADLLARLKP